jgi:OmpA-OmpF porin, OOP family
MSINLLDMLKTSVGPEITKQACGYLGESESSVKAAVDAIFPTLIGGLMQTGKSSDGAAKLLNQINSGPSIDASMLGNLAGLFSGGERTGTLLGIGSTLLRTLFGDKADGINAALSGMNNMKAGSGGSLMAMITPLLFGMLKNHVSAQKLDAGGLMKLLSAQAPFIAPALSDKTTYAMGLGSAAAFLGNAASAGTSAISAKKTGPAATTEPIRATASTSAPMTANAPPASEVAVNAMNAMNTARNVNYADEPSAGIWKKILPVGILAIAGFFAYNYFGKGKPEGDASDVNKNATATNATPSASSTQAEAPKPTEAIKPTTEAIKPATEITKEPPAAATVTPTASGMKSYSTPDGGKIEVTLNSMANKLLAAITTSNTPLNKPFNLDKLIFNTDSADLGAEGRQQLQEVADVLKAFPSVQIKLNGHADNSGDRASNKILSSSRAAVVKDELSKLGINTARITTDSFSASQPIASNATEGGRQQNRRVEIAITKR